jgi:hypothetical protein
MEPRSTDAHPVPTAGQPARPDAQADPPAHDDFPPGTLVGVAEDGRAAAAVIDAARTAGGGEAYLLEPSTVIGEDVERRDRQGLLEALYQVLGSLVSDQRPIQDRYLEHARAGRPMVVVPAPDEGTAEQLWHAMRAHGARDGTWYGASVVREML